MKPEQKNYQEMMVKLHTLDLIRPKFQDCVQNSRLVEFYFSLLSLKRAAKPVLYNPKPRFVRRLLVEINALMDEYSEEISGYLVPNSPIRTDDK